MEKMKKRSLAAVLFEGVLICLLSVLVFLGCNSNGGNDEVDAGGEDDTSTDCPECDENPPSTSFTCRLDTEYG